MIIMFRYCFVSFSLDFCWSSRRGKWLAYNDDNNHNDRRNRGDYGIKMVCLQKFGIWVCFVVVAVAGIF